MEFQTAFIIAIRHAGIANFECDITLVDDTVCAEVFRGARLDEFLSVDEDVDVTKGAAVDGEGTDGDGVCRDIVAVECDILHHDQIVVMGVVAEAESPCVVMVDSGDGEIHAVQRDVHLEFVVLDIIRPVIDLVGGEIDAQIMVASAGVCVEIV